MDINFKEHIQYTYNLNTDQVEYLIDEFNTYYNITVDEYIRRRHDEMKADGMKNNEIYKILKSEIKRRRFAPSKLSERQIRRIIYG